MYLQYYLRHTASTSARNAAALGRATFEFYLAGAGVGLDFMRRPDPQDEVPYPVLLSRQSTQLNCLSAEQGRFEGDRWVVDFIRNGDESNYQLFVHGGQAVRIRLNPAMAGA